ncbi:hypothetical protein F5Y16DRAFT_396347 [Xylariaceae sp. FL0255]|nr:hypothetical protein F5Y16DRAFT_396347 [Xylariaceae sp. FL0255]
MQSSTAFLKKYLYLRSSTGRAALQELISLYSSGSEVNRPGLETCLCARPRKGPGKTDKQLHVYECVKKNSPFAEFCFICNVWLFESSAWEQHCCDHLAGDPFPVELGWEKVNDTWLPGHCPFCLHEPYLAASARLRTFNTLEQLQEHIGAHDTTWLERCPDKRCIGHFDAQTFEDHMYDVHRIPLGLFRPAKQGVKEGRKRRAGGHQPR